MFDEVSNNRKTSVLYFKLTIFAVEVIIEVRNNRLTIDSYFNYCRSTN